MRNHLSNTFPPCSLSLHTYCPNRYTNGTTTTMSTNNAKNSSLYPPLYSTEDTTEDTFDEDNRFSLFEAQFFGDIKNE